MKAGALITDMTGLLYKPAWLGQIVQGTATTNDENSLTGHPLRTFFI
jgi:hypothetical protein